MRALRGVGFKRGVEVAGPLALLQLALRRRWGHPLTLGVSAPSCVVEHRFYRSGARSFCSPGRVVRPHEVLGFVPSSVGVTVEQSWKSWVSWGEL